jgi:hypothetical protein
MSTRTRLIWFGTIMVAIGLLGTAHESLANSNFSVTALASDDGYQSHWEPAISDNGDVVWSRLQLDEATGSGTWQILLRTADGSVRELAVEGHRQLVNGRGWRSINARGDVVWMGTALATGVGNIFLYEAATGQITRLTDYTSATWNPYWPEISDTGDVVWSAWDGNGSKIFLRRADGTVVQLTDNTVYGAWRARINARGDVAWLARPDPSTYEDLFLFERETGAVTRIATGAFNHEINANGDIVWEGWGQEVPGDIFLYRHSTREVVRVTNTECADYETLISDNGDIIWTGSLTDCGEYDVFLRKSDGTVTRLTQNPYPWYGYWDKDINANGDAVFALWGPPRPNYTELYAYLSHLGKVVKVDDQTGPEWPQMNNRGEIVWQGRGVAGGGIFMARMNDADSDGVPDGLDACPTEDARGFDANKDGCIDSITELSQIVKTLPPDVLSPETKTSLATKVEQAQKSQDRSALDAAINQLQAFIQQVQAQQGKKISLEVAAMLIAYANNVISQLDAGV